MDTGRTGTQLRSGRPIAAESGATRRRRRGLALWGGGTDGNEQLTAVTGVVLIGLLAVIGLTILRMRQLISVHLFVGFLLLGPVALKMGTTGYRFARYYARDPAYRRKGPPEIVLRLIAPIVVVLTVAVFASGIVLMFIGPAHRGPWLSIHKVTFIAWIVFAGLHVLGHLPGLPARLRIVRTKNPLAQVSPGGAGRWIALVGAIVAGVVIAIALIPHFAPWTAAGALSHHHHFG